MSHSGGKSLVRIVKETRYRGGDKAHATRFLQAGGETCSVMTVDERFLLALLVADRSI